MILKRIMFSDNEDKSKGEKIAKGVSKVGLAGEVAGATAIAAGASSGALTKLGAAKKVGGLEKAEEQVSEKAGKSFKELGKILKKDITKVATTKNALAKTGAKKAVIKDVAALGKKIGGKKAKVLLGTGLATSLGGKAVAHAIKTKKSDEKN